MAGVTNFKDRITDLAGSLGTVDNNAIEQWVIDGCYDVIARVKQVESPMSFVVESSSITASNIVALSDIRDLISVERGGIECSSGSYNKRHLYTNNDSIYFITEDDPLFYIYNGTVTVKPNPTVAQPAKYGYIPEYTITNFDSGTSSIDYYPEKFYDHVVLYAAIMTLIRRMLDLISDTAVSDLGSVDNLRDIFNADKPASGQDVFDLLGDEDIDLVQATLETVQGANSLLTQKYTWLGDRVKELLAIYMGKFGGNPPQGQG